jgi:hypothetical protein
MDRQYETRAPELIAPESGETSSFYQGRMAAGKCTNTHAGRILPLLGVRSKGPLRDTASADPRHHMGRGLRDLLRRAPPNSKNSEHQTSLRRNLL